MHEQNENFHHKSGSACKIALLLLRVDHFLKSSPNILQSLTQKYIHVACLSRRQGQNFVYK